MPDHDYFALSDSDVPSLRAPVLIAAFKGWNDAAESASSAVRYLQREWSARALATMETEDFYDYTETRPRVRLRDGFSREVEWPSLKVYTHVDAALPRDVVLLSGHEPQLRWPTFTRAILGLLERLGVREVVLLGALLADVPHTRPQRLVGSASDEVSRERLRALDVSMSRYEGPTGIVGVLQDACGRAGLSTVSLWGNVSHYITASPNPQVSLALLRHLVMLLDLPVSLRTLEGQARRFRARVDEAIAQSPEAATYVRELEGREGEDEVMGEERSSLPTGPEVVRALEEYLRQQRSDGDGSDGDGDDE